MQSEPSYRIYTPTDLKRITPMALRTAPPPPSHGGFAVAFVLFVALFVGGASFAALHFSEVDLSGARTSLGTAPASSTPPVTPPLVLAPMAADPPAPLAAAADLAPGSSARRKPRGHRRSAAPSALPANPF